MSDTRPAQRYASDELLLLLREASERLGGVLTAAMYDEHARVRRLPDGRRWPLHQTVRQRFGSWRKALEQAGLVANPSSAMAGRLLFEEAHCVDALRHVERTLGRTPSAAEYARYARASRGALPSLSTVRNRCGSWSRALRVAGLSTDAPSRRARP